MVGSVRIVPDPNETDTRAIGGLMGRFSVQILGRLSVRCFIGLGIYLGTVRGVAGIVILVQIKRTFGGPLPGKCVRGGASGRSLYLNRKNSPP